jgi:predicted aspartyl protease
VAALLAAALPAGSAAGARTGKDEQAPLKVVRQGKQVLALVAIRINGHGPYSFALDTGASRSLIDTQVAKELGVPEAGGAGKIGGVNGVRKAVYVKVRSWSMGSVRLPRTALVMSNLPFGNASHGIQGLLGSDVLSRYDVITIDYSRQLLQLHPR